MSMAYKQRKHFSLFCRSTNDKIKKFYNIGTRVMETQAETCQSPPITMKQQLILVSWKELG
jgi:hypothetical protein